MPGLTRRGRIQPTGENASVTQLELFFDLILVFAFTMVTDLAAAEPTAVNMLRSLLVLAVLWWVWIGFGTGRTGWLRPVTAVVLCALTPLAAKLPALAASAVLCAVLTALIGWETLRFAETRDHIRHPAE